MASAEPPDVGPRSASRREQHKRRMSRMPWLYFAAPPEIAAWAQAWQAEVRAELEGLEAVRLDPTCFIAPTAELYAEPRREIVIGPQAAIATGAYVHGPVVLGAEVTVNAGAILEGGRAGIEVGAGTRIAAGAHLFAFEHGLAPDRPIRAQRTRSRGIRLGEDVWVGARAGITDGVTVGDHAVVAMGAVLTRDVAPWAIVAGVPARPIGDRRRWGDAG